MNFYNKEIDISRVFRIYPAVLIEYQNEQTEMSLEWIEQNSEKVKVITFLLVFDYDKNRTEQVKIEFENQKDVIKAINEIYEIIKNKG